MYATEIQQVISFWDSGQSSLCRSRRVVPTGSHEKLQLNTWSDCDQFPRWEGETCWAPGPLSTGANWQTSWIWVHGAGTFPHELALGDAETGEQLYHRSPLTGVKVLSPTSGFPTWGSVNGRRNSQRIRLWRLVRFDCRTSTGLGVKQTPLLEGTHKIVCTSGPRWKEQWPHRRLKQTYLLVLGGVLQRQRVAVAHRGDKDTGSRSSGKYSLAWALPESAITLTKEPVGSGAGSPQAKQPTGRKLSPTHQQTRTLKFYWALPTRATPSFTQDQSLPSGGFHKPLR